MLSRSVVSDSVWPHGLFPPRLLWPWGFSRQEYWSGLLTSSPGDLPDPGIEPTSPALAGGFFTTEPPGNPKCLLAVLCLATQLCSTLYNSMDCSPPGSSVHEDSPGKNTGVGCHSLLQGIILTWGSNPRLLHWQADSLPLSHLGSSFSLTKS